MSTLCFAACCFLYERRPAMSDLGYVISLTVRGPSDIGEAKLLARELARSLQSKEMLPGMEPESTTVAYEGDPFKAHWTVCGLILGDQRRCMLASSHQGDHSPLWSVE